MNPIDIFITIHATSEWNELGRSQGHCDTLPSEKGKAMAIALATRKDLDQLEAIYTSDLRRAYNTALPLSQRLDIPIKTNPMLREGNWANYYIDPLISPLPFDGPYEDHDDLAIRAVACMDQLAASESHSRILVVTHGGFLRNFMRSKFPEQHKAYAGIRTAINHLQYQDGQWAIINLNDDSHLTEDFDEYASMDHG